MSLPPSLVLNTDDPDVLKRLLKQMYDDIVIKIAEIDAAIADLDARVTALEP